MTSDHTLEGQVQAVLNEMLGEGLLPFALDVGKITRGSDKYTVHFYDSRMPTTEIRLIKGQKLRDTIRSSVLAGVAKMSPPRLPKKAA